LDAKKDHKCQKRHGSKDAKKCLNPKEGKETVEEKHVD
jgi:hypothetical protein